MKSPRKKKINPTMSDLDERDMMGQSNLHLAAEKGYVAMVHMMLEKGASSDIRNSDYATPMMLAAKEGHVEICRHLLAAKAYVNAADREGHTALSMAAGQGFVQTCKLLTEAGAKVDIQDNGSNTPLHHAAANGHLEAARYLVEDGGADVRRKNKDGDAPLQMAMRNGHSETAMFLLQFEIIKKEFVEDSESNRTNESLEPDSLSTFKSRYEENFEHLGMIGQGTFGVVFEAKHKSTGFSYAIKRIRVLHSSVGSQILRKVRCLEHIKHPNILTYYDSWEETPPSGWQEDWDILHLTNLEHSVGNSHTYREYFYLQTELCGKDTLEVYFSKKLSAVNKEEFIGIFLQILEAVKYIHNQSYIHRDLKPSNIFFSKKEGTVKVGELGLVKDVTGYGLSQSAYIKGTDAFMYMSTEQAYHLAYDHKTDIFSLGVIFCEGMTSFHKKEKCNIALMHLRSERIPIEFSEQNPQNIRLLENMVREDPQERPSAEEIENELFSLQAEEKILNFKISDEDFKLKSETITNCQTVLDCQNFLPSSIAQPSNKLETELLEGCKNGDLTKVRTLVENEKCDLEIKGPEGERSLHLAVENGHEDVVNFLLEKNVEVDATDRCKLTALHFAAIKGNRNLVELLLQKGASPFARDQEGDSPLQKIQYGGSEESANLLLRVMFLLPDDESIPPRSPFFDTDVAKTKQSFLQELLLASCFVGDTTRVYYLLKKRVNLEAENRYGLKPLHVAAQNGKREIVFLLLDKGAKINAKDGWWDMTPLHWAAVEGHKSTVELLLQRGADSSAKDGFGRTPLQLVQQEGKHVQEEIITLLKNSSTGVFSKLDKFYKYFSSAR